MKKVLFYPDKVTEKTAMYLIKRYTNIVEAFMKLVRETVFMPSQYTGEE